MPETKYVKIVFDGQSYWLRWRWRWGWPYYPNPTPGSLTADYSSASGPFDSVEQAKKEITEGWTLLDFASARHKAAE